MSADSVTEIKPNQWLILRNGFVFGISSGIGIGIIKLLLEKELSVLDYLIILFASTLGVASIIVILLIFGFYNYLSLVISGKEITGFGGGTFTRNRVTFALEKIDIDKTNKESVSPGSFIEFWMGKKIFVWAKDGQKILIEKSLFSSAQIKTLSERTGCVI